MRIKDEITFSTAKLDTDTDKKYLGVGDSDYFLNCELSIIGNRGVITNRQGNRIPAHNFVFGTEENKCIGTCADIENNRIYFFVYSNGTDPFKVYGHYSGIYQYDILTDTIEPLLLETNVVQLKNKITGGSASVVPSNRGFLDFDPDKKIVNPFVVDGKLYWTNTNGEPNKINIEKAYNYTAWLLSGGITGVNITYAVGTTPIVGVSNEFPVFNCYHTEPYDIKYQLRIIATPPGNATYEYRKSLDNGTTWTGWIDSYVISEFNTTTTLSALYVGEIYDGSISTIEFTKFDNLQVGNSWEYIAHYTPMYETVDKNTITVIRPAPTHPPITTYCSNNYIKVNKIRGSLYQFAYQYIYDDYEYSTFSPHSDIDIPKNENLIGGNSSYSVSINNVITVGINTGGENVTQIRVAVKEGENGAWKIIENIDKRKRYIDDNDNITINFYNDKVGEIISQADAYELYSLVPQKAGSQELLKNKRIVYGDITEGYDNTQLDVNMFYYDYAEYLYSSLKFMNGVYWKTVNPPMIKTSDDGSYRYTFDKVIHSFLTMPPKDTITFGTTAIVVKAYSNAGTYIELGRYVPGVTPLEKENYEEYAINGLITDINNNYPFLDTPGFVTDWRYATAIKAYNTLLGTTGNLDMGTTPPQQYPFLGIMNFITHWTMWIWCAPDYNSRNDYWSEPAIYIEDTVSDVFKTLKHGSYHNFGIVYKDEYGRCGGVQTNDKMKLYVKPTSLPALDNYRTVLNPYPKITDIGNRYISLAHYEINHIPPEWAYSYEFVKQLNDYVDYIEVPCSFDKYQVDGADVYYTRTDTINGRKIYVIGINKIIQDMVATNPKNINQVWTWEKGDRIKFVSYEVSDTSGGVPYYLQLPLTDIVDVDIIGQHATDGGLYIDVNGIPFTETDVTDPTNHLKFLFEVYRPRKETVTDNKIFYTIGESFDVINPGTRNRMHSKGNTYINNPIKDIVQDQTPTQPAMGVILFGDSFLCQRFSPTSSLSVSTFDCESKQSSDYYESDLYGYGKAYGVIPNAEQKEYGGLMRWSEVLLEDTQINGLSHFLATSLENLSDMYGKINAVRMAGDVLKVIQESKVTSYYVEMAVLSQASVGGNNVIVTAQEVLGTKNVGLDIYGTQNPESVSVHSRNIYFWDAFNGTWVRNAPNGSVAISKYGMGEYFYNLANQVRNEGGDLKVYSTYDEKNDLLICTHEGERIDEATLQVVTIVFEEYGENGRWKGFRSGSPEYYGNLGNFRVSFVGGQLWVEESLTESSLPVYNKFYGTEYPIVVRVYDNKYGAVVKVFNAIELGSNKKGNEKNTEVRNTWNISLDATTVGDLIFITANGLVIGQAAMIGNEPTDAANLAAGINLFGSGYSATSYSNVVTLTAPIGTGHTANSVVVSYSQPALGTSVLSITNNNNGANRQGWYSDNVVIAPSDQYPSGMLSKIRNFKSKEGRLYTEFLKDKNTKPSMPENWNLINGHELRGEVIYVDLKNDSNDFVKLDYVGFYNSVSNDANLSK